MHSKSDFAIIDGISEPQSGGLMASLHCSKFPIILSFCSAFAIAQDIPKNVTYVCNGERLYVESCNIRDLSDTSTCMVAHPDRPQHNGLMAYTTETRGALKKLLPTCQPPSAKEVAAEEAFQKKLKENYDAAVRKANPQLNASNAPAVAVRAPQQQAPQQRGPQTPEQRALNRCITSGRLPASCTGNSLVGAFGQMISQVAPGLNKEAAPGPNMAGVFQGAGNWRLDFITDGVLVNCSFLAPDQHNYTIDLKTNRPVIVIDTTPKPLVLTLRSDGTIVGPGPLQIDGVVASGSSAGGGGPTYSGYKDEYGHALSDSQAATSASPVYNASGNRVYGPIIPGGAPHATFSPRTATCPALNLSAKGAGVGVETMQTDLLKSMFGGDKGAPTPPGIRMRGIFAASTGFSAQFFPESVILGCGPDAARAYPYTVVADAAKSFIKIDAPDHPLNLTFRPDGSLDAGSGPYQVHGRIITGQNENDDFTFAPLEQTCNLAVLTPSKQIPSGGAAAGPAAATAAPGTNKPAGLPPATAAGSTGTNTLVIVSGLPAQPGTMNALAGHPYVLLRESFANVVAKGGVAVPQGMSPYKYFGTACASRSPDCQKIADAIKANAAPSARADVNGRATISGLAAGTYYLMITARYNNQAIMWDQGVEVKPGSNSLTLDLSNGTALK